jgi:hypothetical protein
MTFAQYLALASALIFFGCTFLIFWFGIFSDSDNN